VKLYPQLPRVVAIELARERGGLSVAELAKLAGASHRAAVYAATGGARADRDEVTQLAYRLRTVAAESAYPGSSGAAERREFDAASAAVLHEHMAIGPAEASRPGVWAFLGCVVAPDLVRWRFFREDGPTSDERFMGDNRGLRNTFGRVWWRAQALRDPGSDDAYHYVRELGEDELVQITERPTLAGNPSVARAIAAEFMHASLEHENIPRSHLLRDAMKRLRRLGSVVSLDALDEDALAEVASEIFGVSGTVLAT
jgi:hypothetical protein